MSGTNRDGWEGWGRKREPSYIIRRDCPRASEGSDDRAFPRRRRHSRASRSRSRSRKRAVRVGGYRSAGCNETANEYECCLGHPGASQARTRVRAGGMRVGARFRRDQPPPDLDLAPGATAEDAVLMTGARARDAPDDRVVPVGTRAFLLPDLPRPRLFAADAPFPCVRRSSPARDTVFSPRFISPRTSSSRDARTAAGCSP